MAIKKSDWIQVVKLGNEKGLTWNSDSSKMTNGNGTSLTPSKSGGSANLNGTIYTALSDLKKSKKW
jgi:hypothetical protein